MTESDNYKQLTKCPYCSGKVVKKGKRKKKYEVVQCYYCKNCNRKFTSAITKGKTYPLQIILKSLTLHNMLYSYEEISKKIKESFGINISNRIIADWLKEYQQYTPFLRMREFVQKKYKRKEIIEESTLIHQQIYHFKYHRAKTNLILNQEFRHYRFRPLQEFLELVIAECPHQIFQNPTKRASEFKGKFNLQQVKITPKNNAAVSTTNFILQAVSNNKQRHQAVQEFMLANDSVTVAVEVPVIMYSDDIRHYKHELNFELPLTIKDEEHITGHIDLIQIRNGSIHIMDFKPSAKKEKPIAQLTLYALALSRLTGIRLFHFKCAWFDSKNYYEFFPLHVVHKLRKRIPKNQMRLIK